MIKKIFFDIGNVLIDIYPEDCIQYWADCADLKKEVIIKAFSTELHNNYETGKISNDDFFYGFKNALPQPCCLKKSDFWRGWDKLLGREKRTIKLLKSLSKDYKIWLLSNTNPQHINNNLKLSSDFFKFINGSIFSFEVGVRKPDTIIYNKALTLSKTVATEVLFIDDLIENIEMAKKLGWNTIHYKNYNSLKEELHYLGIETSELN
jgi:putative hydrolase of the HAD superfamily